MPSSLGSMQDPSRHAPLIAGSVGPYGACQHDGSEYHGNYVDHMSSEQLVEWHRPRVARLVEAGVDVLACETLPAKVSAVSFPVLIPVVSFPVLVPVVSFPVLMPVVSFSVLIPVVSFSVLIPASHAV